MDEWKNGFESKIKSGREFLFWLALQKSADKLNSDPELALKWMRLAFEQTSISIAEASPQITPELDIDELAHFSQLRGKMDFVQREFDDQLQIHSDEERNALINKIILNHDRSAGQTMVEPESQDIEPDLAHSISAKLLNRKFEMSDFNESKKMMFDFYSDSNIWKIIAEIESREKDLAHKGRRLQPIFEDVCALFPDSSKHFQLTLTGYIAASFGLLSSKSVFAKSARSGSYRTYLRDSVRHLMK